MQEHGKDRGNNYVAYSEKKQRPAPSCTAARYSSPRRIPRLARRLVARHRFLQCRLAICPLIRVAAWADGGSRRSARLLFIPHVEIFYRFFMPRNHRNLRPFPQLLRVCRSGSAQRSGLRFSFEYRIENKKRTRA